MTTPDLKESPEPTPLAPIALSRFHILTWGIGDLKTKGDGQISNLQLDCWSKHDIIRVHNL